MQRRVAGQNTTSRFTCSTDYADAVDTHGADISAMYIHCSDVTPRVRRLSPLPTQCPRQLLLSLLVFKLLLELFYFFGLVDDQLKDLTGIRLRLRMCCREQLAHLSHSHIHRSCSCSCTRRI